MVDQEAVLRSREAVRRYRAKNLEKCKRLTREWYARNKEHSAEYSRKRNLLKRGFTLDGYALARAVQGQACAICRTLFVDIPAKEVHADHDHQSSTPRGVLCHHCNAGLGLFRDSPELLASAASYLTNPTMKEIVMLEPKVEDLKAAVLENTAALRELIATLSKGLPTSAAQVAAVVEETKVSESKVADKVAATVERSKVADKPKPEAKAKPDPKVEEAAATPEPKDDGAPAIELQQVIDVTLALGKAGKRAELVELLGEFGVAKSSLLDPSDFAGFHAKATALLEG